MTKQFFSFTSNLETYGLKPLKPLPKRKPRQSVLDHILSMRAVDIESPRIVGNGKKKRSIQISGYPMLFKKFSDIAPKISDDEPPDDEHAGQQMLDFVKRYGRLTNDEEGDDVHLLLDKAGEMKHLRETFKGRKRKLSVPDDLKATVSLDPETRNIDIQLLPQTLLQALWLQLFYSLSRGEGDVHKCRRPGCTKSFSAGAGTKRSDAEFCSKECQVLFNSLKRSNPSLGEKRK
jgi:hypothetical protein